MSGTRVALARSVAIGVALALALSLLAAREAGAAKYTVAQCGWHVGADASWSDTTGGVKFRPDAWCVPPAGANPFDGVHMKSFSRGGHATVSGNRYAGWRWHAPPTTGITRVDGTWWQVLRDGMQQRIGGVTHTAFTPFATASTTNTSLRGFGAGFSTPVPAIEDRLLCARAADKWCSLDPGSWSSVRALTIVVQDDTAPSAGIGGAITAGGWRKGAQGVSFSAGDAGAGVRFGEVLIGSARVLLHEHNCAKAMIGGEWRATRMQPCATSGSAGATIDTTRFSDGSHTLRHCATDFAGNAACTGGQTIRIDNNPPAHPRKPTLAGGEGWRRVNDFDFSWTNPDQGPASPIGAAFWQIVGPAGYDTGVHVAAGRDIAAIADRRAPGAGAYTFRVWLRDEAGNDAPASAVEIPIWLDDVAPGVGFEPAPEGGGLPDVLRAEVLDAHSGPKSGEIQYRRLNQDGWLELPSKLVAGEGGKATISARLPERLDPGTYLFRAVAADRAGNSTVSTRRVDGTEMALRLIAPAGGGRPGPAAGGGGPAAAAGAKTRLFAQLRWGRRVGSQLTVPFGAAPILRGRLVSAAGAGLGGRRLRVVARPSRGALGSRRVAIVRTGARGGFRLLLPRGTSRRVTVAFRGGAGLGGSRRAGMLLRVRGAVTLTARPKKLRTGATLHLRGRVKTRGAAVPRRGKLIAIQYFERSAQRWRPVLVTRTDHSGRYRARYRFRYVSGAARIRLRALTLPEELWPYAPGPSRPLVVRVSG